MMMRSFRHFPLLLFLFCAGVLSATAVPLAFSPRVDFGAETLQTGIAVGDLDGDGKPDVVVPNYYAGTVSVYRNTSTPGGIDASSFAPRVNFTVGNTPIQVRLVDLDGDGKLDIVCVNQHGDEISLLRNTATAGTINNDSFAPKVRSEERRVGK